MKEVSNKLVILKTNIDGAPQESDFLIQKVPFSLSIESGSNHIIVKCLYVSIDPYQLNRMKSYSPSHKATVFASKLTPGQGIDAMGVGRIVASEHSEFKKDELVVGHMGWAQYVVVPECGPLRKIQPLEFPLSYHLGVLGFGGFSAYVGFFKICKPKKGEKVLVSAAMGSVGNLVGQFAKLFGCYVVGCAGSQDKVELLKDKFGFDNAFNYKEERDLNVALQRYFPEGIDIYFDNVGGEMLEAAVSNMNKYGRVAACGVISEYTNNNNNNNNNSNNDTNDESKTLIRGPNMIDVIYKCLTIQGFIVSDHKDCFPDFISTMEDHLRADRIKVIEDVSHGVESIPSAFVGLFCGRNVGKKVVQIEDDHTIS